MNKGNVICAIVKNEAKYILEWIAFHRLVGFDYFYLYDHGSEDNTSGVVANSPFSDIVEITKWTERPGQLLAYRHFISTHAFACNWAAFIDADEFIFPVRGGDISSFLIDKNRFSAILVNWLIFGSSNHIASPSGLVIDNYVNRYPEDRPGNRHVKTIAKGVDLIDVTDTPHIFKVTGETCNANGIPTSPQPLIENTSFDEIVINHYFTKSKEDWDRKLQRGKADTQDLAALQYKMEMFFHVQHESTTTDTRITRYSSLIRSLTSAKNYPKGP